MLIVYVGAVAVLFLFVVMMLNVNMPRIKKGFTKYLPIGSFVSLVIFLELIVVVGGWHYKNDFVISSVIMLWLSKNDKFFDSALIFNASMTFVDAIGIIGFNKIDIFAICSNDI